MIASLCAWVSEMRTNNNNNNNENDRKQKRMIRVSKILHVLDSMMFDIQYSQIATHSIRTLHVETINILMMPTPIPKIRNLIQFYRLNWLICGTQTRAIRSSLNVRCINS